MLSIDKLRKIYAPLTEHEYDMMCKMVLYHKVDDMDTIVHTAKGIVASHAVRKWESTHMPSEYESLSFAKYTKAVTAKKDNIPFTWTEEDIIDDQEHWEELEPGAGDWTYYDHCDAIEMGLDGVDMVEKYTGKEEEPIEDRITRYEEQFTPDEKEKVQDCVFKCDIENFEEFLGSIMDTPEEKIKFILASICTCMLICDWSMENIYNNVEFEY